MATRKTSIDSDDLIHSLKIQASIAREERARAEALFSSIGEGIIATDEVGKIIRVNQKALDILGFEQGDLIGKSFTKKIQAVDENDVPISQDNRPINQAFSNRSNIQSQVYYLRKNGKKFPAELTVSPVRLRNRIIGAIEIFRDVTLENEMDKLKTNFISLASHQLRTPLTTVQTYASMLTQGYAGEMTKQQRDFLKIITDSSERMNNLISTLLSITRIEAGHVNVEKTDININQLIEDVVAELAPYTDKKHLTIELKVDDQGTSISNDHSLIQEILTNLLVNSVKYTPDDGKVSISASLNDGRLLVSVADTGYGIPVGDQPYIFSKFYRASNISKLDTTGTGLGLYLIKNIVEQLNGEIWFKSKEGKGTTFYLSLPL